MTKDNTRVYKALKLCAEEDVAKVIPRDIAYASSWKKRGGIGAFMMLARKWDRIENDASKAHFDIFEAINADGMKPDGLIDDIRDLRRYLLLVEAEMLVRMEDRNEQTEKERKYHIWDATGQNIPFGYIKE